MKAITCYRYGEANKLTVSDLPKPEPIKSEVLVKVKATAINDFDWSMVTGKPKIYRLLFGLKKPKRPIPGIELAGIVEATGPEVKELKVGDEVYGDISEAGWGSFTEYVCVSEKAFTIKPKEMSFEEAASLPHAAMLAYQGLIEDGKIDDGQKVLINGAGGGVGMIGIQIAKKYNVNVTGIDSQSKLNQMKEMGYNQVLDYRAIDFTTLKEKYDLILDTKTNRPIKSYAKVLKPEGKYVTVGGTPDKLLRVVLYKMINTLFSKKSFHIVTLKPNNNMEYIHKLYLAGQLKCVIDGPYSFDQIPEKLQYFGEGKHTGKVIIKI